jgi:uncharacterized protein YyaL (SSP411 family)
MANKLINEQSPYLLQHAHNPVDWYPWGDEAFEKAKTEHKPVLVSIGYAACHWCHVMEHESFENEEVAAFMNEHFVCIKVDREEHPDVDHMYMDAVQAIGGSGGWPLNVFATPDRAPFYGGTYFPPRPAYSRPSWMQLLQRMNELWHGQQDEIFMQAEQMVLHLQQASARTFKTVEGIPDMDTCRQIADNILKQADKEKGGFGNAPKFPGTMAISFLLEHYHFTKNEAAWKQALRSLDAMIEGGIYDQLGGGFARYATDRNWLIPHFEKMLYDNALLIGSLCDAYQLTKDEKYKAIAQETIAFVEKELKNKEGGYYCAIDADSEGVEGKFYTWKWDEWIAALGENEEMAAAYFGVSEEGNWEETNILHVSKSIEEVAAMFDVSKEEVKRRITSVKQQLLAIRGQRIRPITDDKSLLSWNALMNIALSKAAVSFGADETNNYGVLAATHMGWMLDSFGKQGALQHTWKNGVARIPAMLDDYAYLVQALMQLASATGNNEWAVKAAGYLREVVGGFSREDGFFYYTAATQKEIPVRKVDLYDGALPSGNAVMAHNLWLCGMCMGEGEWVERAKKMLHQMADTAMRYGYSFGYWSLLLQRQVAGMKTVVCAGVNAGKLALQMREYYLPQAYLLVTEQEAAVLPVFEKKFFGGKMYIFVCTEQACLSPVSSAEEAFYLAANH